MGGGKDLEYLKHYEKEQEQRMKMVNTQIK